MAKLVEAKQAKCKRCGDEQVAWCQSPKTGKWYLAPAYKVNGTIVVNVMAFHQCPDTGDQT